MTAYNLLEELQVIIRNGINENIGFINEKGTFKTPQVRLGYLAMKERKPGKPPEDEEDFPYILIRYNQGEDEIDSGIVKINILLGAYRNDETGWIDILNMIETIRKTLKKQGVFSNGSLEYPIKYNIPVDQAVPFFQGEINLTFSIGQYSTEGGLETW